MVKSMVSCKFSQENQSIDQKHGARQRHPTGWQPMIFDELSETQQLWLEGGQKSISALVQLWPSWPLRLRWPDVTWKRPEVSTAWYCLVLPGTGTAVFVFLLLDTDQIWPGRPSEAPVSCRESPLFGCPKTVILLWFLRRGSISQRCRQSIWRIWPPDPLCPVQSHDHMLDVPRPGVRSKKQSPYGFGPENVGLIFPINYSHFS